MGLRAQEPVASTRHKPARARKAARVFAGAGDTTRMNLPGSGAMASRSNALASPPGIVAGESSARLQGGCAAAHTTETITNAPRLPAAISAGGRPLRPVDFGAQRNRE